MRLSMQLSSFALLLVAATAMASRPTKRANSCTPNKLEAFHLGHGHDINSGDVKVKEGSIEHLGLKVPGGSGCAPDWSKVPAYSSVKGKKGAGGAKAAPAK